MSFIEEPKESDEERYLLRVLADLQRRYSEAAKPFVDRLVRLRAMRMPKYQIPLSLWEQQQKETPDLSDRG